MQTILASSTPGASPMTDAAIARIFSFSSAAFSSEAGLPRRAMRMTVVIDELGEGHAVLMVRTNRGDFVLDNKTSSVLPWHRTGYVYIKRESQDTMGWVSLGGIVSSPTTTANR